MSDYYLLWLELRAEIERNRKEIDGLLELLRKDRAEDADAAFKNDIRGVIVDLITSAGCGCCRDYEKYEKARNRLGEMLNVPQYSDGSGYDFYSVPKEVDDV